MKTLELNMESGSKMKLSYESGHKIQMNIIGISGKQYPDMELFLCDESGDFRTHFEKRCPINKIKRVTGLDYKYVGDRSDRFLPVKEHHQAIIKFMDECYNESF